MPASPDRYWVYGGFHPFNWFPLGWRQAEVETGRRKVTVRLKTQRKMVRLNAQTWAEMVARGEVFPAHILPHGRAPEKKSAK